MPTVRTDHLEAGCYADGCHGQRYVDETLAGYADLYATQRPGPHATWAALVDAAYADNDDLEPSDIADECLEALNNVTTGGFWHFHEGDLFLSVDDESED